MSLLARSPPSPTPLHHLSPQPLSAFSPCLSPFLPLVRTLVSSRTTYVNTGPMTSRCDPYNKRIQRATACRHPHFSEMDHNQSHVHTFPSQTLKSQYPHNILASDSAPSLCVEVWEITFNSVLHVHPAVNGYPPGVNREMCLSSCFFGGVIIQLHPEICHL